MARTISDKRAMIEYSSFVFGETESRWRREAKRGFIWYRNLKIEFYGLDIYMDSKFLNAHPILLLIIFGDTFSTS